MKKSLNSHVMIKRIARVQQLMREESVDYLVIAPTPNLFYLTGLRAYADERLYVIIVPSEGQISAIVPQFEQREVKEKIGHEARILDWADGEDPVKLVTSILEGNKSRVGIDDRMWAAHMLNVMRGFVGYQYIPASQILSKVRVVKDETEIARMQEAGDLADKVMLEVIAQIKPGVSEKELAFFIEKRIKELGADDIAFKPIVASGPNGSTVHHFPGERRLQKGDFITFDFGAITGGYQSDITRTYCLGKATEEMKKVYRIVYDANEAGFQTVKKGIVCEDVDRAARHVISEAGYGEYFIHRTGHGIGLDTHEEPYMVAGNRTPLEVGMVHSVEPGIYIPGKFGVRIEDIVAILSDGPLRFNNVSRELMEI